MVEYVVAAGGKLGGLMGGFADNPTAIAGVVALLIVVFFFTTKG